MASDEARRAVAAEPGAKANGGVLLLGADGMLGKAWEEFLVSSRVHHDAVGRRREGANALDVTDADAVERVVARGYEWVINCTAYTAVDAAETAESDARRVNGDAVGYVAHSAARHGAKVVHYSTDYVFSGRAHAPYEVDAPIAPINAYGRSKALGEALLLASGVPHLLIRTSWVYAPWGKNFFLTMRHVMAKQPRVSVVDDQHGRPTSVFSLVDATWRLMQRSQQQPQPGTTTFGTYHVADSGDCTWFGFAEAIRDIVGAECEVLPCSTQEFPRPAPRPEYSVLSLDKTVAAIGALPHWKEALTSTARKLEEA